MVVSDWDFSVVSASSSAESDNDSAAPSGRSHNDDSASLVASLEGVLGQMAKEDEVAADARLEPAHFSNGLAVMLDRATQPQGLTWSAEPMRQGSVMDGSFYDRKVERPPLLCQNGDERWISLCGHQNVLRWLKDRLWATWWYSVISG